MGILRIIEKGAVKHTIDSTVAYLRRIAPPLVAIQKRVMPTDLARLHEA
jgi:hypothetical protein